MKRILEWGAIAFFVGAAAVCIFSLDTGGLMILVFGTVLLLGFSSLLKATQAVRQLLVLSLSAVCILFYFGDEPWQRVVDGGVIKTTPFLRKSTPQPLSSVQSRYEVFVEAMTSTTLLGDVITPSIRMTTKLVIRSKQDEYFVFDPDLVKQFVQKETLRIAYKIKKEETYHTRLFAVPREATKELLPLLDKEFPTLVFSGHLTVEPVAIAGYEF